jgi:hypothetical protein
VAAHRARDVVQQHQRSTADEPSVSAAAAAAAAASSAPASFPRTLHPTPWTTRYVAPQVAFERQTLKPVFFNLIGYRLWV